MASEQNIINDLLDDYKAKQAELKALRSTIELLAKKYDVQCTFPEDGGTTAPNGQGHRNVKADQFFGLSQPDAAEAYLKMVGHAVPLEEILEALRAGGMKFSGQDPSKTLYTQLVRATLRFVRVPNGSFGLLEWYPSEQAKRSRANKGNADEETDTDAEK